MDARVESAVRRFAPKKGIAPALLLAVVKIECPWKPFEADGTTPRFLFERHVFYKQLAKNAPERLAEAVAQGLAIPKWSRTTQYKDLGSSSGRMRVLQAAVGIDMECAYRSISMGIGQVMGFNAMSLGYGTATQMFSTLRAGGITAQLDCMWRFMESKPGMLEALKAGKWEAFARAYNGPAFAQNDYDTRLANAYASYNDQLSGKDPEEDDELPLGRTPVQNAEPGSAWRTPEGVATGVSAGTGVAAVLKDGGKKDVHSPMDYAFAFVIVVAVLIAGYFFIKRLRRNPE